MPKILRSTLPTLRAGPPEYPGSGRPRCCGVPPPPVDFTDDDTRLAAYAVEEAVVRELREETGYDVGPSARRRPDHRRRAHPRGRRHHRRGPLTNTADPSPIQPVPRRVGAEVTGRRAD